MTFRYACRSKTPFRSCQGKVFWNGYQIAHIIPEDYKINYFRTTVRVNQGVNVLKLAGAGCSDSYGLTVDSVRLARYGTSKSIVINGGFEYPCVGKGKWRIFNDIPGWWGKGF